MTPSKRYTTTKVQDEILQYWKDYEKVKGHPPSLYEAAKALHYKGVSSIQDTLERLIKKGLMEKKPMLGMQRWHTYELVNEERTAGK